MSDAPSKQRPTEEERRKLVAKHLVGLARYNAWRMGVDQADEKQMRAATRDLLRAALAHVEEGGAGEC